MFEGHRVMWLSARESLPRTSLVLANESIKRKLPCWKTARVQLPCVHFTITCLTAFYPRAILQDTLGVRLRHRAKFIARIVKLPCLSLVTGSVGADSHGGHAGFHVARCQIHAVRSEHVCQHPGPRFPYSASYIRLPFVSTH